MTNQPGDVTALLDEWVGGAPEALSKLFPLVLADLRKIAQALLARENKSATFQTTDLVNEVYLHLAKKRTVQWKNSRQFFCEMVNVIRRLLVDRARARQRQKRGSGKRPLALEEAWELAEVQPREILALETALNDLERKDSRQALIVQLRYYVGLTYEETGAVLGLSGRTVKREWQKAKLWLFDEIAQT